MPRFASSSACFRLSILFLSLAALGMVACGGNSPISQTGGTGGNQTSPPTLVSIAVTPASPSVLLGSTQQLTATGAYSDRSSKDITSSVQWTSAATSVASVSSSGLATALATGISTITASVGSVSGSASLTVTAPKLVSIIITPATPSIMRGSTQQFTATGSYSDGSSNDITSSAQWNSATATVASVSSAGLATALSVGTSTITATVGSISGAATLTVTAPALVSIAVTPAAASLPLGSTQQFTATGSYSDGSRGAITSSVQWASATPSVASVNSSGRVTSVSEGTSTITASVGSISGSAALTVTPPALVSIAVTPAAASLPLGSTQQFTATGTYTDKGTADLTDQIDWSTINSQVAAINASGLASPSQIGFTKVTATMDGISGAANLAVVGVPRYLYDVSYGGLDVSRLTINASTGQPRYLGYQTTRAYDRSGEACITIDPSQKFAYVSIVALNSGVFSSEISTYSINTITGALTLLPGSPYRLTEVIGCIQFAPPGNFAYAIAGINEGPDDLVTLAKGSNGNFTVVNSIPLPNSLGGLAIGPRGKFLYLTSEEVVADGAAYAYGYAIDSTTGALTPIDSMPIQLPNNTDGLFSFNPSGDFLYMADMSAYSITTYAVNRTSGALTKIGAVSPCVNPGVLQFSPDGEYAYEDCSDGTLTSYSVDSAGQLTTIGVAHGKVDPQTITVDPSGQFLYVISYNDYLSTYKIGSDGAAILLSETAGQPEQESIAILPGISPVTYTTKSAYITTSGDNQVSSYTVNADGTLTPVQSTPTLTAPFAISTLPWAWDFLLASNQPKPNLQAYTANNSAGAFTAGVNFGLAAEAGGLVMDPSGVNAFDSDPSTGLVHWYGQGSPGFWEPVIDLATHAPGVFTAGDGAGPLAMDPAGRYIFVANQSANSISEFQFHGAAPVPDLPLPASPLAICTGPTGNHVFVAGSDDQLRMLTVDRDGNLTDSFDIGLPATPTSVAVEPTGNTVYVTSTSGISAFTINQQAGTLTALPLSISVPLANATGVYIDPSGQYLYVSVSVSTTNALYLFTINADGALSSEGTTPVATPDVATSMAFHARIQ